MTEAVENILAHHGIRGMKWGVRRSNPSGPVDVSVIAPAGKRVRTGGGQGHPASEDAKTAAAALQKSRASTIDSLSNHELKALTERLQLESRYSELVSKTRAPTGGKAFVAKLLRTAANNEVQSLTKGSKGPIMKQLEVVLSAKSGGKHRK